jgi:hypothetical protein
MGHLWAPRLQDSSDEPARVLPGLADVTRGSQTGNYDLGNHAGRRLPIQHTARVGGKIHASTTRFREWSGKGPNRSGQCCVTASRRAMPRDLLERHLIGPPQPADEVVN